MMACGQDLLAELAKQGFALAHTPYWSGLSICGLLGTGAHGSSLWQKGGATHEYVTSVRTVVPASVKEGYAKVRTFTEKNPKELAACKVHLGLLGIFSHVTLEIEPLFKRGITFVTQNDDDLERMVKQLSKDSEFPDVAWFPSQRQVRYRYDNRVPIDTPGDGSLNTSIFDAYPVAVVRALRDADLQIEKTRDAAGQCARAAASLQAAIATGFNLDSDPPNPNVNFTGYPLVGFTQNLQAEGICSRVPDPATVDPQNPTNLAPDQLVCLHDLGPELRCRA